MRHMLMGTLSMLLFAGCTGAQRAGEVTTPTLTVRTVLMGSDGKPQSDVKSGDVLEENAQAKLLVKSAQDSYLYVLRLPKEGAPEQLFPPSEDQRLTANQEVQIPVSSDIFLRLDPREGEAHFLLIGSLRRLDGAVCAALGLSCKSTRRGSDDGQVRSETQDPNKRGGSVVRIEDVRAHGITALPYIIRFTPSQTASPETR